MGSIDDGLPHGDSPNLELLPATPEERIEALRLNSAAWKGPLSVEKYIEREDHLLKQKLTRDGGLTIWILVDPRQPSGARAILGSCETIRKPAFLAYDGKVEDIIAHGIGSVFVRPEFRGRGYAGRMMHELGKKLETWQAEKLPRKQGVFSVLFSDVGKKFYARFGWKPFPSSHLSLPPITAEEYRKPIAPAGANIPQARLLTAEDVRLSMCSDLVIRKERELLRVASETSPGAKVAIAPDYDHMLWHWAREEFYEQNNIFSKKSPVVKGAGVDSQNVYCTWARTLGETAKSHTLYVLRWVYDEPRTMSQEENTIEAMAAVLRRAQLEAHETNMSRVDFWNPTPLMVKAAKILDPNAEVVQREQSSITSLKWNGAQQGLGDNVEWFFNEKYSWC
jgi:GNAT superfamily N-acetyltransferase